MKGLLVFTVAIMGATVFTAYELSLLDNIVHGTLYKYGLTFSYNWANPYWMILRVIQVLLGVVAVCTIANTVYLYRKHIYTKPEKKKTMGEKIVVPSSAQEPQVERMLGLVRCPSCQKSFSQPLRMLDFHSERPRIVNICPFCNEVIPPILRGEAEKDKRGQKGKKNNKISEAQETVAASA